MAGVSLVGFSGSLIKNTLRPAAPSLGSLLDANTPATGSPVNEPIETPEATKVVIGICNGLIWLSSCLVVSLCPLSLQVFFSYCLRKFCK